ncbi:MAG: sigma-70 family RNA polymerase sigma factor [Bacteroidales bacterium]
MRLVKVKEIEKDKKLVLGCLKNDRNSQKLLYDRFSSKMLAVCIRYASSKDEAEDVMIEGFMLVFTHLETYNFECSLEFWIRRIMTNKAISNFRSNKKRYNHVPLEESQEISLTDNGACDIETTLTGKELVKLIKQMPENLQLIFNLRVFEEYSHKEIAEALAISESNSRVYFLRARQWIEKQLNITDEQMKSRN